MDESDSTSSYIGRLRYRPIVTIDQLAMYYYYRRKRPRVVATSMPHIRTVRGICRRAMLV